VSPRPRIARFLHSPVQLASQVREPGSQRHQELAGTLGRRELVRQKDDVAALQIAPVQIDYRILVLELTEQPVVQIERGRRLVLGRNPQLHAGLELVNGELFAIYGSSGTLWDIIEVPDISILHLDY